MAGVAANEKYVIVADRDLLDKQDIFRCLNPGTGEELWTVREFATGELDYGNSPRATPLIHGDLVFLYNAFSRLQCVRLSTGKVVWKRALHKEFAAEDDRPWGTSSSPLLVDGLLIVNPGAPQASLVALRPETGEVVWKTPGDRAAYSSCIVGTFGGKRQLIGYEEDTLCGYEIDTGKRLWRMKPPRANDFNVPTPIAAGESLFVTTENNGSRLYRFDQTGRIITEPVAINEDLAPDTHTPVIVGDRIFGVWGGLHCLSLADGLATKWTSNDLAFDDYASLIASEKRVLVTTMTGELILFDTGAEQFDPISRVLIFPDGQGAYSHPALVGTRLYVRGDREIVCLDLSAAK